MDDNNLIVVVRSGSIVVVRGGSIVVVCGGSIVVVRSGSIVVVRSGSWWFVVVRGSFSLKFSRKYHVTHYLTNQSPRFSIKSHFE